MTLSEFQKGVEEALVLLQKQGKIPAGELPAVAVEVPEDPLHGDYATSVALRAAGTFRMSPMETASLIAQAMNFEVEVASPGFLNARVSDHELVLSLQKVLSTKERYGFKKRGRKKVMVEFTDPNPFKEFHIGHLYSNAVGESLARLFEATGAQVKRVNYQGDVGLHVAKAVWGMRKKMEKENLSLVVLGKRDLSSRVKFLGASYAAGDGAYRDGTAKEEIEELNKKIFEKDKSVRELYEKGRKWSLEKFEEIYKLLGTKFDAYYFESDVGRTGKELVEKGLKKGVFERSQGAVIFPGEKYGLHSRVFINSQGLPTYEAKELGLAPTKYKDFKYDESYIVTGNEITEYFKVLIAALREINPKLGEKTKHISHGMLRLPEGKMSSRSGNVVTAESMIDEVRDRVRGMMKSSSPDIPSEQLKETVEDVAVGAVKYSLLKVGLGQDIAFDFTKSLTLEGASGPYLQYAYARSKSILRESGRFTVPLSFELSSQERSVARLVYRFPEVVERAALNLAPSVLCAFAFELAHAYNHFYNTHRVLQAETERTKEFRLALTAAAAQVLRDSLFLLGIRVPERM